MLAPARYAIRLLSVAVLLTALAACAGELSTPGEALRLLGSELPEAIVNEPYQARFHAVGGLRPYEFTLADGALPPGLELRDGELRGVPNATGNYEFSLRVTDANLSSTSTSFDLVVSTPPTPALELNLPQTEVRGRTTLRARVVDARGLVGLRTELTWDPARFALEEGSLSASRQQLALLQESGPGRLRVDLALLGTTLTGDAELFSFALVPTEVPATIAVASSTEFASRTGDGFRHEFDVVGSAGPGAAPAPTAPDEEALGEELEDGSSEDEQPVDDGGPEDETPGGDGAEEDSSTEDEPSEEQPVDDPGDEP